MKGFCYDSEQTATKADRMLVFFYIGGTISPVYHLFINSNFNAAKLDDKRITREKSIKRESDAFQGYSLTIYTPTDTVQMGNQATKQRQQWTVR